MDYRPQVTERPVCEACGSANTIARRSQRIIVQEGGVAVARQKQYRQCRHCGANFTCVGTGKGKIHQTRPWQGHNQGDALRHENSRRQEGDPGGCGQSAELPARVDRRGRIQFRPLPRCRQCLSTALRVRHVTKRHAYQGIHPVTGPYTAIEWRRVYCACCGQTDQLLERPYRPRDWRGPPPDWPPA